MDPRAASTAEAAGIARRRSCPYRGRARSESGLDTGTRTAGLDRDPQPRRSRTPRALSWGHRHHEVSGRRGHRGRQRFDRRFARLRRILRAPVPAPGHPQRDEQDVLGGERPGGRDRCRSAGLLPQQRCRPDHRRLARLPGRDHDVPAGGGSRRSPDLPAASWRSAGRIEPPRLVAPARRGGVRPQQGGPAGQRRRCRQPTQWRRGRPRSGIGQPSRLPASWWSSTRSARWADFPRSTTTGPRMSTCVSSFERQAAALSTTAGPPCGITNRRPVMPTEPRTRPGWPAIGTPSSTSGDRASSAMRSSTRFTGTNDLSSDPFHVAIIASGNVPETRTTRTRPRRRPRGIRLAGQPPSPAPTKSWPSKDRSVEAIVVLDDAV